MKLTLLEGDVAEIPFAYLYPDVSEPNTLQSNSLGQSVDFMVSSCSAVIRKLRENSTTELPVQDPISSVVYNVDTLHIISGGKYTTAKFDETTSKFTDVVEVFDTLSKDTCSGFAFNQNNFWIGCFKPDGSEFTIFTLGSDGKQVGDPLVIVPQGKFIITKRLWISLINGGAILAVYDDLFVEPTTVTTQQAVVYYIPADDIATGTYHAPTVLGSIGDGTSTVNLKAVNDIAMDTVSGQVNFSVINQATKVLNLQACTAAVSADPDFEVTITGCSELGVADLSIEKGRVQLFYTSPRYIIAYDQYTAKIHKCIFAGASYSKCSTSCRNVPVVSDTTQVSDITNFGDVNVAIHFANTQFSDYLTVTNMRNADYLTDAFNYEVIREVEQQKTICYAAGKCIVFHKDHVQFYKNNPNQNAWGLQISSEDIPDVDKTYSDVSIKRIGIQITKPSNPPVSKFVQVHVMNKMTDIIEIKDNLPDYGGVVGARNALSPIERSWFKGNNLLFDFSKSTSFNADNISNNGDVNFPYPDFGSPVNQILFATTEHHIVITDDLKVHLIYCAQNCNELASYDLPKDTVLHSTQTSTPFPKNTSSEGIFVFFKNTDEAVSTMTGWYILLADPTQTKTITLGGATDKVKEVHVINYNGTLLFFATIEGSSSIQVYGSPVSFADFEITPPKVGEINADTFKVTDDMLINPSNFAVCPHNGFVFEFNGPHRIYKVDIGNIQENWTFTAKGMVRVNHPYLNGGVINGFCPMGDEFVVWAFDEATPERFRIYSTSTADDETFTTYNLEDFDIEQIRDIRCLSGASSFQLLALSSSDKYLLATFFGNSYDTAHTRVHSVVELTKFKKGDLKDYSVTPLRDGTLAYFISQNAADNSGKWASLAGPVVKGTFSANITDPNFVMKISSGTNTVSLTKDLVMHKTNATVIAENIKDEKFGVNKGNYKINDYATLHGHVGTSTLVLPEGKEKLATFTPR